MDASDWSKFGLTVGVAGALCVLAVAAAHMPGLQSIFMQVSGSLLGLLGIHHGHDALTQHLGRDDDDEPEPDALTVPAPVLTNPEPGVDTQTASYCISTGCLSIGTKVLGHGYSGNGVYRDDATQTMVKMHGPIPVGCYSISAPADHPRRITGQSVGAYALELTPDPANKMHGRGGFFCHGDNARADHTASDGCIVIARAAREALWASGLRTLVVSA